jgi:HPt (histidine-containing phosphotransfer) domain-containing protein
MTLFDELKALGVNTDDALQRFMGNSALYEKMLKKFVSASAEIKVMPCFESGDYTKALETAHTLKGVTGNLSLTPLYNAYSEVVSLLRVNDNEGAQSVLSDILPVQDKIVACISGGE